MIIHEAAGVRLGRPCVLGQDVVARILDADCCGAGWSAIARDLNADGTPTAHGGTCWHPATVRKVYLANDRAA